MRGPKRLVTRPPVKQSLILNTLRSQIIDGVLTPEAQLPTRTELEQRFDASRATVQRALDSLIADGFVYARGRKGTFVAEAPPHLSRYGVVFAHRPAKDGSWSRFWTALRNEALSVEHSGERRMPIYYGPETVGDESYQQLVDDVMQRRFAGLIFASPPYSLADAPPITEPGLPRVVVAYKQEFGDVPSVNVNTFSFVDKALDYLVSRGRRRVAVVLGSQPQSFHAYLAAGIAKRGLESEPYWMQSVSPHMPEAARNCAHLLMHAGQKRRPDGLIIADDNLVEHAVAGLVAAGADVAGAVEVIVHCNFPWPTPSVLPVRRLGYDVRRILSVCIECIDQQRRGERPQAITLLPALFEDEVASQVNSGVAAGV